MLRESPRPEPYSTKVVVHVKDDDLRERWGRDGRHCDPEESRDHGGRKCELEGFPERGVYWKTLFGKDVPCRDLQCSEELVPREIDARR